MIDLSAYVPQLTELREALVEAAGSPANFLASWTRIFNYSDPPELGEALVRTIRNRCASARTWCEERCQRRTDGLGKVRVDQCWSCFLNTICEWDEAEPFGERSASLVDDLINDVKGALTC